MSPLSPVERKPWSENSIFQNSSPDLSHSADQYRYVSSVSNMSNPLQKRPIYDKWAFFQMATLTEILFQVMHELGASGGCKAPLPHYFSIIETSDIIFLRYCDTLFDAYHHDVAKCKNYDLPVHCE